MIFRYCFSLWALFFARSIFGPKKIIAVFFNQTTLHEVHEVQVISPDHLGVGTHFSATPKNSWSK